MRVVSAERAVRCHQPQREHLPAEQMADLRVRGVACPCVGADVRKVEVLDDFFERGVRPLDPHR